MPTTAVLTHREYNPGEETIFFNDSGLDPSPTYDKCNFRHFAFDQNISVKMEGLIDWRLIASSVRRSHHTAR